jgi:hypothetical protein
MQSLKRIDPESHALGFFWRGGQIFQNYVESAVGKFILVHPGRHFVNLSVV